MRFLFQKCVFSIRGLKVRLFLFATMPPFRTNLHFRHLPRNFNLNSWLTVFTNWLKWRFVPKWGELPTAAPNEDFGLPNERLGTHFLSTFHWVSTRFGLRSFEKYFENAFKNVRSDFQNLRFIQLMLPKHGCPKRRFWMAERTFGNAFS